jgi:beta-glucanase (GH16 family)
MTLLLGHTAASLLAATWTMATTIVSPPGWKLVWHDEFETPNKIDTTKWSPSERATSDWNNTVSKDPRCYVVRDGTLRLMGIENTRKKDDPSPFLTGAITSKDKFSFRYGKVQIRARFKSARGAWPALWMLGSEGRWPGNGEIDLMEHLNFDDLVYQTVHSVHTTKPGGKNSPKASTTAKIDREAYNTYGAEWDADKITFTVNGKPSHTYPRVPEKGPDQWPFDRPFYLILSMQIGGAWVGEADPKDYPAWLEIDWVRVYSKEP